MKKLITLCFVMLVSVGAWASSAGGGITTVIFTTSTNHNDLTNLKWSVAGHIMDDKFTDNYGVVASTLLVNGAQGASVTYGLTCGTATLTNSTYAVSIASSSTSGSKVYIGGAFASLPTTGFNAGSIIVLTSDWSIYVASETVVGTQSWVKH